LLKNLKLRKKSKFRKKSAPSEKVTKKGYDLLNDEKVLDHELENLDIIDISKENGGNCDVNNKNVLPETEIDRREEKLKGEISELQNMLNVLKSELNPANLNKTSKDLETDDEGMSAEEKYELNILKTENETLSKTVQEIMGVKELSVEKLKEKASNGRIFKDKGEEYHWLKTYIKNSDHEQTYQEQQIEVLTVDQKELLAKSEITFENNIAEEKLLRLQAENSRLVQKIKELSKGRKINEKANCSSKTATAQGGTTQANLEKEWGAERGVILGVQTLPPKPESGIPEIQACQMTIARLEYKLREAEAKVSWANRRASKRR
jgi:hypothetical protein